MDQSTSNELHLFLGRVEGKLDAVISSQASLGQRLNAHEGIMSTHAERIVTLETQKSTAKHWIAVAISIFAAIASVSDHIIKGLYR